MSLFEYGNFDNLIMAMEQQNICKNPTWPSFILSQDTIYVYPNLKKNLPNTFQVTAWTMFGSHPQLNYQK